MRHGGDVIIYHRRGVNFLTAFQYPRHNLSIRVSTELDKEIERAAEALKGTKTDVVIYALCLMLDPTGKSCPDVAHLPDDLRTDFAPPPLAGTLAGHFFEPDTTDWQKVIGEDMKLPKITKRLQNEQND